MHILKLDAIDSTNTYLKDLMLSRVLEDFTVIVASEQLKGRGQMGAEWQSKKGNNLTLSILKKFNYLPVTDQFLLNICVSLAILDCLKKVPIPNLSVKWPNDILSGNTKICGILIENVLSGKQIQESVIGIGLNVNQLVFDDLTNVSSMKLITGRTFDLDELLQEILMSLKAFFNRMEENNSAQLWKMYEQVLFRKDKPSTFRNNKGELFMGFIRGVSPQGKLMVELENAVFREFDLKQIKLLY